MDQRIPREPGLDARDELFAELYAAHFRPLVALCRRRGGRRDAEELAQEAFLRAWSSWEKFAPARPFWPWVSTIANRLCIDHGRRLRTAEIRGPHAVDTSGTVLPSPEEAIVASEEYQWARAALAQLKPDHQRVLALRDIEGWSYDRIANHEGVTVESVRGSLRRARSHLRLAYARVSSSSPAVVLIGLLKEFRRRISEVSHRISHEAMYSGVLSRGGSEAVAAIVVIVLGTTPGGIATGGSAPATLAAPPSSRSGVVVPMEPMTTRASTAGSDANRMLDGEPSAPHIIRGTADESHEAELVVPGTSVEIPAHPARGASSPESGSFDSFTASPNYANDREVYASGFARQGCALVCPELLRSTDGGAHWSRLDALGFEGGVVMLPPSYPRDSRIFVGGPHALKVSKDGGKSFLPLTPAGGYTAMSPAFSSGDGRILVGAIPGWIYHDDSMAVTPFDAVPQSTSAALSFSYAPAYPGDHRIVIGGTDPSLAQHATVSACDVSKCTAPALLAGITGTPAVMTSRSYSSSGLAFAWSKDRFFRSLDGAGSFARLALPAPGQVQSVAEDVAGRLYVGLWDTSTTNPTGGLFVSSNSGTTWSRLGAGTELDKGVLGVTVLPSGNILAGPYAAQGGGLECSSDNGRTWSARCP